MTRGCIGAMISAFFLAGAAYALPDSATGTPKIVATVGGTQITYKQYTDRYEDYLVYTGAQDNKPARYAILNNMINEILLREHDDNSKVYGDPEYKKEITWAWKSALLAFLKDQEIYANITVTDEELRTAYQRSKSKLSVRHLYAPTEGEAEKLYRLVKMGVSFKELAKQVFTDTALKNNGGNLGYITWGETDPNFERVAYSLKVGEVSRPVKTAEGYSIIKVDDRIDDPFTTENEYVNRKHKLDRAIRIDKKRPYERAYLASVFDTSRVKFNENALMAVCNDLKKINGDRIESNGFSGQTFGSCVQYKDKKYTGQEIENKLMDVPAYSRSLLTDVQRLKKAVLGLLIQDVLLNIAKEKGYDTTSYVKETFNNLANNIYLNFKKNEVLELVPVADSEITKYYHQNIASYSGEREMNVQEIIVENDSLALVLRKRIDHGASFGTLASKYSQRKWSAKNKGIMGLSPISNFGELKDTLWNLARGKVLGPVKFDKYYGIFRVVGRQEARPIDVSLVRDQIAKALKNEKGFPYMKKKLEELSKETTIKVNDDLVKNYTMNLSGK